MKFGSFFRIIVLSLIFASNLLAQNPYNWAGEQHNEVCKYILNNLSARPSTQTYKETVRQILTQNYSNAEFSLFDEMPQYVDYNSLVTLLQGNSTAEAFTKFKELENAVKSLTTVADINAFVANKERTAENDVSDNLRPRYLMALAILKSSAKCWFPVDKGGEYNFSLIKFSGTGSGPVMEQIDPAKLLSSDFAGCFFGGASTLNPGGAILGLASASCFYAISAW